MGKRTRLMLLAAAVTALGAAPRQAAPVSVAFRNVHLHVAPGVVLEIDRLEGALLSTTAGRPPVFDDQKSFSLRIDSGEIAMSPASLSRLLNDYVFAFEGSPLKDVEVSLEQNRLKQKGTLQRECRSRSRSSPSSPPPVKAGFACARST